MDQRLRYSHFVRERIIDAAIKMMVKVGCDITQTDDGNWTTLTVHNPPDPANVHDQRVKAVLELDAGNA